MKNVFLVTMVMLLGSQLFIMDSLYSSALCFCVSDDHKKKSERGTVDLNKAAQDVIVQTLPAQCHLMVGR